VNNLNIAICGAGPARLAAAIALHRAGHHITLYDQFDAPKPMGSGLILQPVGLAVLDWLGLGNEMRQLGATIDRLFGRAIISGRVVLDVRYDSLGPLRALAVHRAGLFHVLNNAVKKRGINIKMSSQIRNLDNASLILNEGESSEKYDLVIDAMGSRSPLIAHAAGPDNRKSMTYGAIWASLPWPEIDFVPTQLEQRYDQAKIMIGVLPIGQRFPGDQKHAAFFWSLKNADFAQWKSQGLDSWKAQVAKLWPQTTSLLANITSPDQMTMARYDHHTLSLPYGPKLVFVGDSAHSTSPQLGQGANMALLDVQSLTIALTRHQSLETALPAYAKSRRSHVKLYQAMSLVFTPFYQSDSTLLPLARDHLVSSLSRLAVVRRLLARIVSGSLLLPQLSNDQPLP
jgi:salicylate hydroxylase